MTIFWVVQILKTIGLFYILFLTFRQLINTQKLLKIEEQAGGAIGHVSISLSVNFFNILAFISIMIPIVIFFISDWTTTDVQNFALLFVPFYLILGLLAWRSLRQPRKIWVFHQNYLFRLDQPDCRYRYSDVQYAEFPKFLFVPMYLLHFGVEGKMRSAFFDDRNFKMVKAIFQQQTLGLKDRSKLGPLAKALRYGSLSLGLVLLVVFAFSLASMYIQAGKRASIAPDFTQTSQNRVPLGGSVTLGYARGTLFAFDETQAAVNAYDPNGKYQYTLNIPSSTSGSGGMYFVDDLMVLEDSNYVTYAYLDGDFLGYYLTGDDTENGFSVKFYNKETILIQSVPIEYEDDFDFGIVVDQDQYCFFYTSGNTITVFPLDGSSESVVESAADYTSIVIPYATDSITVDGVRYYQAWGSIHKVTEQGVQIIVQSDILTWYANTPDAIYMPFLLAIFFLLVMPIIMNVIRRRHVLSRLDV